MKGTLTKLLCVALVACMLVAMLAACTGKGNEEVTTASGEQTTEAGDKTDEDNYPYDVYAGEAGKDYTDEKFYTSYDSIGGTTGLNWNPHSWETNDDSYVLDYTTMGFYSFVLNGKKDGYTIVPEMAAKLPVDVTSNYVGKFGVVSGDTAKAWRIELNKNATWDDGTKITADDYIYSMQQLLDPLMLNRRADSYYAGDFTIVNAKNYLYAGKTVYSLFPTKFDTLDAALAAGDVYLDMDFWGLVGAPDKDGNAAPKYVNIKDETLYRDASVEEGKAEDWVSAKYLYETYLKAGAQYEAYAGQYLYVGETAAKVTWNDVGLVKVDEYTIDIILENEIEEPSFYVPYNLSSMWLVKKDLYEKCKKYFDADGKEVKADAEGIASVTCDYCTSVEKSASYGPYKLTYFQLDKQLKFERNDKWYGYSDNHHLGQYQTDAIVCNVITEHKTSLQEFLAGNLDGISLDSADMEKYASSKYIMYTPQSYTTKLTFNTDLTKLKEAGRGSEVLTILEFREAFALCIDREEFTTQFTSSHKPGFGLLNYMYCYNPTTGELYRDSDAAKEALVKLYGIEYGDGKEYEDLDEAYDAITGYDMAAAQALMKTAYTKAIEAGVYTEGKDVKIQICVYSADEIYNKMFNYLKGKLEEACKGSGFEGKVTLEMKVDADYYETMYSGGTDIIFSTWGGAAMSPFGMLAGCYTDASDGSGNQMEYGYDTTKVMVTLTVGGKEVTSSLHDWANWCNLEEVTGITDKVGKFTSYTYTERCEIFAELEYTFLASFTTTPIYYRNVASLRSAKINYPVDTYLQVIGFGGTQFVTYNYDDATWETVKSGITY